MLLSMLKMKWGLELKVIEPCINYLGIVFAKKEYYQLSLKRLNTRKGVVNSNVIEKIMIPFAL